MSRILRGSGEPVRDGPNGLVPNERAERATPGFAIFPEAEGFHIRFPNGWIASVQWHPGTAGVSTVRTRRTPPAERPEGTMWNSQDAEVHAYHSKVDVEYDFAGHKPVSYENPGDGTPLGRVFGDGRITTMVVDPTEVVDFLALVRSLGDPSVRSVGAPTGGGT